MYNMNAKHHSKDYKMKDKDIRSLKKLSLLNIFPHTTLHTFKVYLLFWCVYTLQYYNMIVVIVVFFLTYISIGQHCYLSYYALYHYGSSLHFASLYR